jgi:hypothetical protein
VELFLPIVVFILHSAEVCWHAEIKGDAKSGEEADPREKD